MGLITPDKYYQENVRNFLLNNGSELEINNTNMTSWNIYQDDEYSFTFKYPDEFFVKKQSRFVRLVCYKDEQLNCPIYINVHKNASKIAFSVIQDVKNDIQNYEKVYYMQLLSANIFRVSTINNTPPVQWGDFKLAIIGANNSLYIAKNIDKNDVCYSDKLNNIIRTMQFLN